ncbi:hypothetical protein E8E11_002511 [Didymella keratinophila]|nr:hypothetical protein E8E11_002511 [Didymella keratinophila]
MFQPSTHCTAEARLSTFFDSSQPRDSFTDSEIEEIKHLLLRCPHYRFASAAPRTFIVLYYIGRLEFLQPLLAEEFEDSWFPIGKRSLPSFLDPRIKAEIVEHQHIIFTKSIDLEKGVHCYLKSNEDPPYNLVTYIGSGSYGQVCKIESKVTCKHYALKTPSIRRGYEKRHVQLKQEFETSPDYGKRINLNRYTVDDCVSVLLDYIATIPELLGRQRSRTKPTGPRLRSEKDFAVILAMLPERNLELILVTLAFFSAYAELGRIHTGSTENPSSAYDDLVQRLAELLHTIVVRPLEPGDQLSIQTLGLVLKTPLRFRSIAVMERSKRAQGRDQNPSENLFRRQVRPPADYGASREEAGRVESKGRTWSRCATAGEETEQTREVSDKEAWSSDDINIEDYDSEFFDAVESEEVPSEAQDVQSEDLIDKPKHIDQTECRQVSETRANRPEDGPRLHESRLLRRRDTSDQKLAIMAPSKIPVHSDPLQQETPDLSEPFRPELWGLSLDDAVSVAGSNMHCVYFTIYGDSIPFSGRIPTVVAKCIEKVMASDSGPEDTATYCLQSGLYQSDPEHFAQLKERFNAPASSYGINTDWSKYTAKDAIDVLFDYLKSLSEHLLPIDLSCKLPSLDNYLQETYVPSDWDSLQVYAICLAKMPDCNRQLLLVLIAFLASQVEHAQRTLGKHHVGLYNEAALRWGSVLSHPLDYRTATFVLLMVNATYFLRKANARSPTRVEWDALIRAREELISEAEDSPEYSAQSAEEEAVTDPNEEPAATTSLGILELQAQVQLRGQECTSTQEQRDQCMEENHTDHCGSRDVSELEHRPKLNDIVSEGGNDVRDLLVDSEERVVEEDVKAPEQRWSWEPLELDDTEADDVSKGPRETQREETEDELSGSGTSTADSELPQPLPPEPYLEPGIHSFVEFTAGEELEHLQNDDGDVEKQDTVDQSRIEPAVSCPQTPQLPAVATDQSHWESMQYLDGVSRPPTPKLETKVYRTQPPKLNIVTPTDDAVFVDTPPDSQMQGTRLTPVQTERLSPLEPSTQPTHEDHGVAEPTVRRKRSHRRSGGVWTSHSNHSRPKSIAGESIKNEKRKSRDDERRRSKDEGEMQATQAAQKNDQAGKKQRKKSNASFMEPKRGFRDWFHGVGAKK